MSKINFQARAVLKTAVDQGAGSWHVTVDILDRAGFFTADDIIVGDIFVFDTNAWEAGTLTKYGITSINDKTSTMIDCVVLFDTRNDNTAPDLTAAIGTSSIITRPLGTHNLLATPSPDTQEISDIFSDYVSNFNMTYILDEISANTLVTVSADEPLTSDEGDLWWDTTNTSMKVYVSGAYQDVVPPVEGGGTTLIEDTYYPSATGSTYTGNFISSSSNQYIVKGDIIITHDGVNLLSYNKNTQLQVHSVAGPPPSWMGFAADDNYVVCGNANTDVGATNSGSISIYYSATGSWTDTVFQQTINNPNPGPGTSDRFGYMVGASDGYAIVGEPYTDDTNTNAGMAYIYKLDDGSLVQSLQPTEQFSIGSGRFGEGCDIIGKYAVVSAPWETADIAGNTAGVIYVYHTNSGDWTDIELVHTIYNPDIGPASTTLIDNLGSGGEGFNNFGQLVKVNSRFIAVGAPQASYYDETIPWQGRNAWEVGAVFIFELTTGRYVRTLWGTDILAAYTDPSMATDQTMLADSAIFAWDAVELTENSIYVGSPYYGGWLWDQDGNRGFIGQFDIVSGEIIQVINSPDVGAEYGENEFGYVYADESTLVAYGGQNGRAYIYDVIHDKSWPAYRIHRGLISNTTTDYVLEGISNKYYKDSYVSETISKGKTTAINSTSVSKLKSQLKYDLIRLDHDWTLHDDAGLVNKSPVVGDRVAVSGNFAAYSVQSDSSTIGGSVLVVDVRSGQTVRRFDNPDLDASGDKNEWFGSALAMDGDLLLVFAFGDSPTYSQAGYLYAFSISTGNLLWHAVNPVATLSRIAEYGLAICGTYAVAADVINGRVFVFDTTNGNHLGTIIDPSTDGTIVDDGEFSGYFGSALAFDKTDDSWLIIGAPYDRTLGGTSGEGVIHIYNLDNSAGFTATRIWSSSAEGGGAPNESGVNADYFGNDLAFYGDTFIASAPAEPDTQGYYGGGICYMYKTVLGDWTDTYLYKKILNPNVGAFGSNNRFGGANYNEGTRGVTMTDKYILITAQGAYPEEGQQGSGIVYLYDNDANLLDVILNPRIDTTGPLNADLETRFSNFGRNAEINGDHFIVSSSYDNVSPGANTFNGEVYVYEILDKTYSVKGNITLDGEISGTLVNPTITGYTETVMNGLADDLIDANLGTIQTRTLEQNTTFNVSISDGQSITLHVSGGNTYTVTWPAMTWVGGSEPTLTANDIITIWKVNGVTFGAFVGSY